MRGLLVLVDLAVRVLPRENERSASHSFRKGDRSVYQSEEPHTSIATFFAQIP